MEQLPNNCRVGKISIHPKNWDSKKISREDMLSEWYIKYRFYDDNAHKEKQVVIKSGVNEFKTLADKQSAIRDLLRIERNELKNGYNPITKRKIIEVCQTATIGPYTPFGAALKKAQSSLNLEGFTKTDMATIVNNITAITPKIFIDGECVDDIPAYEIKKRHVRAVMNKLSADNKWSAHSWNKYRSYLMMLFKELGEYDAVESNIPREISKRKTVKKIKTLWTKEQRIRIRQEIEFKNPRFWLFLNMFFHSGARISEFFRIKIGDVNFERQTVKVTIKKGRQYIEVIKPIKDIALPFWEAYLTGYDDRELFIMGKGLYPAAKPIRYDQIDHRWLRVKNNINKDKNNKIRIEGGFYMLKYINSDEVSEQIGIERAQKLNSHTSTRTTKIYAINENARELELIKKVSNEF